MSEHDQSEAPTDEVAAPSSGRRELFTKAGAAAAVVAVAGLASSKSVEAANGENMVIGQINDGTSSTRLQGGSSLWVKEGSSFDGNGASIRATAIIANRAGVRGEASGDNGKGVYGVSTGSTGQGVRGENSGSDGSGVHGLTSANGSTGAGVRGANTGDGHGVKGETATAGGAGVYGTHTAPAGRGVYGHYGNTTQAGTGVLGIADVGVGVDGRGTQYDLRAGSSGRLGLDKVGHDGSPTDGAALGTIARDSAGNLWYCYATDKWQRLGGPGSGGSFHPIAPVRVFDSRNNAFPTPGVFAASSTRVISVKDGRDKNSGAVTAANAVPAGAAAVAFNVTATNTAGGNFLAVVPGDVAASDVSTLNWSGPGISIANASVTKLDGSRQIRVISGPGGSYDAIIDISGYYI